MSMPHRIKTKYDDLTRILLTCGLLIYVLKFATGIAWSILSNCINIVSFLDACVGFSLIILLA